MANSPIQQPSNQTAPALRGGASPSRSLERRILHALFALSRDTLHISAGTLADAVGTTPTRAAAALIALERAGLTPADMDVVEINEAFASVAVQSSRDLGIDSDRVNVNGGAVALGHPVGASGARLIGTLVYELRRRGGGRGLAAICSGGGQGDAIVVRV